MSDSGNMFIVELKAPHLSWGEEINIQSSDIIQGEAYIPVPREYATQFNLYNSNYTDVDVLGLNIFNAESNDGTFSCCLKA